MKRIRDISLKNKLIMIILSVVMIAATTGFSIFIVSEHHNYRQKMKRQALLTAKLTGEYCVSPLDFGYPEEARDILSKLETVGNVESAFLFDDKGELFASYSDDNPNTLPKLEYQNEIAEYIDGKLFVFQNISFKDDLKGTIALVINTDELKEELTGQIFFGLAVLAITVFLAYIPAYQMQRFVSRPILNLTDFAEEISRTGEYTKRIEKFGEDETGILYDKFNEMMTDIEKRNKELIAGEERYRVIAEEVADVLWSMNPDFTFSYISPSVKKQRGYTPEEAQKLTLEETMTDEAHKKVMPLLYEKMSLIEIGSPEAWDSVVFEAEVYKKDGATIWTRNNVRLIKGPDGKQAGIVGLSTDITDSKEARIALRASEKRYRTYIENAPDGIFLVDESGKYTEVNKSACDLTGHTKAELLQMSVSDLLSPEATPEQANSFHRLLSTGFVESELLLQKKDGTNIDVVLKAVRISKDSYLGFCTDITKRKQDERIIRETGELLEAALNRSPSGIMIADAPDVKVKMANEAALDLIGDYSGEAGADLSSPRKNEKWQAFRKNGEKYPVHELPLSRAIRKGEITKSEEIIMKDRHGNMRIISANAAPIKDEEGNISAGIVIFHDITQRKEAEDKLNETNLRMKLATDSAGIGVWDLHLTTNLLIWDDKMHAIYGTEEQDFSNVYEDWSEYLHPEDKDITERQFAESIKSGNQFESEFRIRTKDGKVKYLKATAMIMRDSVGKPTRVIGVNYDITSRKKAELQITEQNKELSDKITEIRMINDELRLAKDILEKNEDKLNRTRTLAKIGGWEIDLDTKKVFSDSETMSIYGVKYQETIQNILSIPVPQDRRKVRYHFENIEKTGSVDIEYKIQRPTDGKIIDVRVLAQFNRDENLIVGAVQDITERKKQEEQIKNFFEVSIDLLCIADLDGYFVKVNSAWFDVVGYTREELENTKFIDYVHPEDVEATLKAMQTLSEGKRLMNFVNRYRTKSGKYRFIEWRSAPGDEIFYAAARDITERMESEEALRISEERLNKALAAVHDGVWDWDIPTNQVYYDDRYYTMAGYSPGDFPHRFEEWTKRVHPDDLQKSLDDIELHLSGKTDSYETYFRYLTKDGSWMWFRGRGRVIKYDKEGKPLRMVGTHTDITERKLMEDKLRENEQKLNTLFKSMTELVVIHDMIYDEQGNPVDYRITECNNAYLMVMEKKEEDVLGKTASEIYDGEPPYLEQYAKVARTGEPYEFNVFYAPLDRHFIVSAVSPGKDKFATISTDITDMKQIEKVIKAKNKELEDYLYITSHDLRSPLVNIQGFSQIVGSHLEKVEGIVSKATFEYQLKEKLLELLRNDIPKSFKFIYTSVSKMDGLIKGLLDISRTGRKEMVIEKIDMNNLMTRIIEAHQFKIDEAEGSVNIEELPDCYGDIDLLNQLFSNLVSNAVKYRSNERALKINISGDKVFRKIIYKIQDNGSGMDKRHLEKIWDVFYRTGDNPEVEGDGIGLSLAKRITDKHKGRIRAESTEGEGSIFYVELQANKFKE